MTKASPFSTEVPTLQVAWDSTSLGWFKKCPRLYYMQMILRRMFPTTNPHLLFGLHLHSALEKYDHLRVSGKSHMDCLDEVIAHTLEISGNRVKEKDPETGEVTEVFHPWESDMSTKNRENLIRSIIWYADHFEHDPAKVIKLKNGKAAVELSFKVPIDLELMTGEQVILCGHFDRVVNYLDQNYVMDRKTTAQPLNQSFFSKFDNDNQMSIYTIIGRVALNQPIAGVMIDGFQIAAGFTRIQRGFTYRSEKQISAWMNELAMWLQLAQDYAERAASSQDPMSCYPRNDTSCWNCSFTEVCSSRNPSRDLMLLTEEREWNPMESR